MGEFLIIYIAIVNSREYEVCRRGPNPKRRNGTDLDAQELTDNQIIYLWEGVAPLLEVYTVHTVRK